MATFNYKVSIPEEEFESIGDSKPNIMTDLQQIFAGITVSGEWPSGWYVELEEIEE